MRHKRAVAGRSPAFARYASALAGSKRRRSMNQVIYEVIPVDGGWVFVAAGVYSEVFPSQTDARTAADKAAKTALEGLSADVEAMERNRKRGAKTFDTRH